MMEQNVFPPNDGNIAARSNLYILGCPLIQIHFSLTSFDERLAIVRRAINCNKTSLCLS